MIYYQIRLIYMIYIIYLYKNHDIISSCYLAGMSMYIDMVMVVKYWGRLEFGTNLG